MSSKSGKPNGIVMTQSTTAISRRMQTVLDACVAEGKERGVQLAAYLDGRLVLDISAGIADPATGKRVDSQTLFPVFSVGKGMTSTAVHQFVERGAIEYETPIAQVWPEFAAHCKDKITLRQTLSHMAGLPSMPVGITLEDLCDWSIMCRRIAALAPEWPAGSRMVYHAMTHGWLLGEVLRRVDGRPFGQILAEDICRPLGIEDELFIGIPAAVEPHVAVLEEYYEAGKEPLGIEDGVARPVPAIVEPLTRMMNRSDARRACIPASNGIMTARALARFYAAHAPGGVDGVELLPPRRIAIATQLQWPATTDPQSPPPRMSMGYFLGDDANEAMRGTATFGHGGYGGSMGFYDPVHRLAVGFTKNLFSVRGAGGAIISALRAALEIR